MVAFFIRKLVPDWENTTDAAVRRRCGMLCSIVGIVLNLLLFTGKYLAGVISGSIAVTADAFNNLSDAGSSLITLVGFRFAGMKPDRDHPFGHGRVEYIAGLSVAVIILVVGVELAKSSVAKIFHPEPVDSGWLSMAILAAAILVKLYMALYNRREGRRIRSAAMEATAADSLTDSLATSAVLLAMLVSRFFAVNIDGYVGVLVAGFILYTGYGAARDTLSPLLGQAPDPELVANISRIVESYPEVVGIHDLAVHDYGPGRVLISLHCEVPDNGDINALHDVIDNAERQLQTELGVEATIHMDPINTHDEAVAQTRTRLAELVRADFGQEVTIHDFRMVSGPTHTNLIFDMVLPARTTFSDEEARARACTLVEENFDSCFAVVQIDHSYI